VVNYSWGVISRRWIHRQLPRNPPPNKSPLQIPAKPKTLNPKPLAISLVIQGRSIPLGGRERGRGPEGVNKPELLPEVLIFVRESLVKGGGGGGSERESSTH
jgi:hypothetical protein